MSGYALILLRTCRFAYTGLLTVHIWPGTLLVKDGSHVAHERFFETTCALSPEARSGLKDWCEPSLPHITGSGCSQTQAAGAACSYWHSSLRSAHG